MTINLEEIEKFAIEVAEAAGQLLLKESNNRGSQYSIDSRVKSNVVDIVTETDEAIEKFIHDRITSAYPHHDFLGEESYSAGDNRKYLVSDRPTWVVDPLDGTVNYVHLFPMVCVSIGFCVGGKPVAGAINAPFLGQTYSASKGNGAWLNSNQKLPLHKPPLPAHAPKGCIFACEWGKDRRNMAQSNLSRKVTSFVNMVAQEGNSLLPGMCHGVRSLGSAALDLCFVATGAFDIWWEGGCWEWDVCAGFIIVEEAGGLLTTANPPPNETDFPQANLGSRLYLAIRPTSGTEDENERQSQERVAKAVWKRVEELDYERPFQ